MDSADCRQDSEEEYMITIKVTQEKEEAIKAFFAHNDWDYVKIKTSKCKQVKSKRILGQTSNEPEPEPDHDPDPDPEPEPEFIQPHNPRQECSYCLLTPCVTLTSYSWEGDGQDPCEENAGIRHKLYTKYWWVIANRGGWNDPRYIEKKKNIGGREWAITHRREIMPLCVLRKTRGLYPNREEIRYLGHKWE